MADYSVGAVATAGFGVIRRKPLAVIGWALFLFLVVALPLFGVLALLGPGIEHLIEMAKYDDFDPETMHPHFNGAIFALNPLIQLLSIVVRAMLCAAVFRAVLEPRKSSFAYLRLGAQELWVALVGIVEAILMVGALIVAIIPVAVICAILGANDQTAAAVGMGFLGGAVILGLMIWLFVRFSMALPMSFAERRFALFESWSMTRGHVGNLLVTWLLVIVLIIAMEMVMGLIVGVALGLTVGATGALHGFNEASIEAWGESIEAFFEQPPRVWLGVLAPWALGIGAVYALVVSVFMTIAVAPLAAAYKALAAGAVKEPGVA